MKLGVLGALPRSLNDLTPAAIAAVRRMGFTGTGLPSGDDPASISTARASEVGRMFADAGVELIEYGRYRTNPVHPDATVRREHLASLREAFRVAGAAGCPAVIAGVGSLNWERGGFPHPENRSRATRERLVAFLREAAAAAADAGALLAIEGHVVRPVYDATSAREVLDAVGSGALRVHLDPVNWLTFETVYASGDATREMFATLGPARLLSAHSKGVAVEEKLIIHMSETVTGAPDDLFDHAALLREASQMPNEFYVALEHLPVERMPAARQHLLDVAARIGVEFA
jgi:sugar phosphate isomerase/epimerase